MRPSPEAAELLNVSARLAATATRVRVGLSGDVEMTPLDQPLQNEHANLRKIVAQLHVNHGHPSKPGPSGCLEDLMSQHMQRSRYDALFANVSQSPLLFLPLLSDVGKNFDNVWHLTSSCLQTSGKTVCFLNMLDMASLCHVVFPVADKNPFTIFNGFLLEFESSFSELAEQIGCRLLPAAAVSPTHVSAREELGSTALNVWWMSFQSSGTILRQNCGFVQSSISHEHRV